MVPVGTDPPVRLVTARVVAAVPPAAGVPVGPRAVDRVVATTGPDARVGTTGAMAAVAVRGAVPDATRTTGVADRGPVAVPAARAGVAGRVVVATIVRVVAVARGAIGGADPTIATTVVR